MTARERYEVVGPLGSGGMAEVLLARRAGPHGLEGLLAIKRILPELANDPDHVRMLLDEARNAASLVHQRIVQVFDIEMRDGAVLYAMEYLHGETLAGVLAREPRLPLDAALAITIALAEGLHYAHTRASPIVHRDVAPSNVMITYDGAVKLIDFGIAKAANNLSNTVYGTFKGRLGYSSPEQCRCELVDGRSDVYSLGLLLYEMTTGARAFTAANERDMLDRMAAGGVAPPATIDPRYPRELEAIVMKAIAPDRNRRYASAQALQYDLEAFARARSLVLPEGSLSRLMHNLFAQELVTWVQARTTGVTLENFVVREVARNTVDGTRNIDDTRNTIEHTTYLMPPREGRRSQRRARSIAVVVAVVLFMASYFVMRLLLKAR